ncbi:MAG: alpha-ribazole phosphatase [Cyclobacteriaceae bacterium]
MEIYLVRHTTPAISKEICYGQSDIPLAATFTEESQRVLEKLPASVDMVYTSPLSRCLQLAQRIPHQALEQVSQLKEMNFGDWELRPWSEIPKQELDPWMNDFVNYQVPNGESMEMLADRVARWYENLMTTPLDKVVVVTHAGPIRIILSKVHGTALEEAFKLYPVDYGEVILIN